MTGALDLSSSGMVLALSLHRRGREHLVGRPSPRLMEAAGDLSHPGLYATTKVESFWATVPGLTYAQHDPEDLDTTQPDHCVDSLRYLVMATNDQRYSYRAGGTDFRVW